MGIESSSDSSVGSGSGGVWALKGPKGPTRWALKGPKGPTRWALKGPKGPTRWALKCPKGPNVELGGPLRAPRAQM